MVQSYLAREQEQTRRAVVGTVLLLGVAAAPLLPAVTTVAATALRACAANVVLCINQTAIEVGHMTAGDALVASLGVSAGAVAVSKADDVLRAGAAHADRLAPAATLAIPRTDFQNTVVPTHRASLLVVNHRAPPHIAKQLADAAEEVALPVEFTLTREALYVKARPGAPTAPSIDGKPPLPMPEGMGPEPVAMYLANQRTENQRYAHISGWIEEARLAQRIHELPDQQVVRWGGKAVIHGEDVISVNRRTGEVTLWDSKFRSAEVLISDSPTSNPARPRFQAMINDVMQAIEADRHLPRHVKDAALARVENSNFRFCTAGAGSVLNSICK
jgi:hypothetical protein